jgi:hypothetical protein
MKCHYCANTVNDASMVSKFMCKYCSTYRNTTGIRNEPIIPIEYENPNPAKRDYFKIKGLICEDWMFHKLNIQELSEKYDVGKSFVSDAITLYLDNSQPINLTFQPNE